MGRIAALAALGVLAVGFAAPAHAAGETVTYYVQADGPLMSVSYYDGMDEMTQESDVGAMWTKSFVEQSTYGLHSIAAQTEGTHVSCEVDINGSAVDQKSAVGRYTMAVCAG
jgi:hypothetical protein